MARWKAGTISDRDGAYPTPVILGEDGLDVAIIADEALRDRVLGLLLAADEPMPRAEIVVWRGGGDWMKVYIDGKLERATHESDFDADWWVELMQRFGKNVALRAAKEGESERE
jgi:hypothetical protein